MHEINVQNDKKIFTSIHDECTKFCEDVQN